MNKKEIEILKEIMNKSYIGQLLLWNMSEEQERVLNQAEKMEWVLRPSYTQVEWRQLGIDEIEKAKKEAEKLSSPTPMPKNLTPPPNGLQWHQSGVKYQRSLTVNEIFDLIEAGGDTPNELTPETAIAYMVSENNWKFYGNGNYGNPEAIRYFINYVANEWNEREADRIEQEKIDKEWAEYVANRTPKKKKKKRKSRPDVYLKQTITLNIIGSS